MPNWVDCHLEITGPKDDVDIFTAIAYGEGERNYLSFPDLLSIPQELNLEKNSASDLIFKAKYGDDETIAELLRMTWIKCKLNTREELIQFAMGRYPEGEAQAEQYKLNFDKFGFTTWKDWCIANWGTKWSAQQVRLTCNPVPGIKTLATAHYHFNTVWTPPVALFRTIGKSFNALEFLLEYTNKREHYYGRLLTRSGQLVQDESWPLEELHD